MDTQPLLLAKGPGLSSMSPGVTCGQRPEDAEHFLFRCRRYTVPTRTLFLNTRPFHPLNTSNMLLGIDAISYDHNI